MKVNALILALQRNKKGMKIRVEKDERERELRNDK